MLLFGFIKKKNLHSYAYDTELYRKLYRKLLK